MRTAALILWATASALVAGEAEASPPKAGSATATIPESCSVHFDQKGPEALVGEISRAQSSVMVLAPWVASEALADALLDAHRRGVAVNLVCIESEFRWNHLAASLARRGVPVSVTNRAATGFALIDSARAVINHAPEGRYGGWTVTDVLVLTGDAIAAKYHERWQLATAEAKPMRIVTVAIPGAKLERDLPTIASLLVKYCGFESKEIERLLEPDPVMVPDLDRFTAISLIHELNQGGIAAKLVPVGRGEPPAAAPAGKRLRELGACQLTGHTSGCRPRPPAEPAPAIDTPGNAARRAHARCILHH
jgi:hypothetical protein